MFRSVVPGATVDYEEIQRAAKERADIVAKYDLVSIPFTTYLNSHSLVGPDWVLPNGAYPGFFKIRL